MRCCADSHSLPRLIYLAAQQMQYHADGLLQPMELTLEQFRPLKFLAREDGPLRQRQLCELAGKNPANMTRILDRLEKKNLVRRLADPDDRRAFLVQLTSHGEQLVDAAVALLDRYAAEMLVGIGEQELAVCQRTIAAMMENLNRMENK